MIQTELTPHHKTVPSRFSEAAGDYNSHARIQKQVSTWLWEWLQSQLPDDYKPEAALDIGSGTGFMTQLLLDKFDCPVHAIDIAPGMIEWIHEQIDSPRLHTHLLDGQYLSIDRLSAPRQSLLVSSMCVQWFKNIEQALRRWLALSNTVAFSVLLDGSFEAWHQAHMKTGQIAGLQTLPTENQLKNHLTQLQSEGLIQEISFKSKEFLDHHFDGLSFARSLRAIGADTPRVNHNPANLRTVIRELGKGCTMNYKVGFVFLRRL
jgi:malonyl-CoA O-methyltransferase